MFDFLKDNPLVEGANAARLRPRSVALHFLLFFLVMTVAEMVAGIPASLYSSYRLLSILGPALFLGSEEMSSEELAAKMEEATAAVMAEDGYLLCTLFSFAITALLVVIFCRFIERRPIASMGLAPTRRSLGGYAVGLLVGLLMAGAAFLIVYATRSVTVEKGSGSVGMLILYLFAFLIQGAGEEILVRGYFMISLTGITRPGAAVVWSAFLFALLHFGNEGVSLLAILNIFLFGVLLGLIVFRTGSLFLACALHGVWNFAEGCLFGLPVSGIRPTQTLLASTLTEGRTLTNGGAFGPEGGAAVTIVLFLAILVFLLLSDKRKESAE